MEETPRSIQLSRRRFLILGAGATGVLAAAYATMRQVGCYPEPDVVYEFLTRKEAAVFSLLGDHLLPPGGGLPGSAGDAETMRRLDQMLAAAPPWKRRLLRALPLVFEHGSGLDRFGARAMTKLPPNRLEEYLAQWENSTTIVRLQLWSAVKVMYGLTYIERPDVMAAMNMTFQCGGVDRWP